MATPDTSVNNVIDFQNTFNDVAENKKAKMLMTNVVTMETLDGKTKAIDSIGKTQVREISGRVVKVTHDSIDHLRRQLATKRYALTIPVDAASVQDIARDPSGKYAERCVSAFNRQIDRVCATAAFSDVLTGEDMTTSVDFATDGGRTVDATAAGINYDKLREIKQKQGASATGTEYEEQSVLFITDKEADTMLNQTQLTSGDYDRLFARDENGSLVKALGIDIMEYPSENDPILAVNTGTRDCIALAGDALAFAMPTTPKIEIQDVSDTYYETKQVNIVGRFGATRREGVRVLKVQTTA